MLICFSKKYKVFNKYLNLLFILKNCRKKTLLPKKCNKKKNFLHHSIRKNKDELQVFSSKFYSRLFLFVLLSIHYQSTIYSKFKMRNLQLFLVLVLINCCFCSNTSRLHSKEDKNLNLQTSDVNTLFSNQTAIFPVEQNSSFDVKFSDESSINNTDLEKITENSQQNSEVYSMPAKIVFSTLASTTSLITISGNLLVMFSFFLDRQIRNPTNYFILSLSVSDFLIGLVSMPLYTLYLMLGRWPFGQIICNLFLSLDYTVCLVSIYTVLFITIDRFCSVKIPAKYRKWRSTNKIIIMVAFTWVLPILIFFPSIFGWTYIQKIEIDPSICVAGWTKNIAYSVLLIFAYFWTSLVVIIVLYIFIYQVALNLERKSREKQSKITSLVGCSASNTATMVGAVALTTNIANVEKLNTYTPEDDQEDDFNTDSQSKLSKASTKNTKKEKLIFIRRSVKKKTEANAANDIIALDIGKINKDNCLSNKNPEDILNLNQTGASATNQLNHSFISNNFLIDKSNNLINKSKNSKEEEFSSSFDSHSDCDIKNFQSSIKNKNSDINISYSLENQVIEVMVNEQNLKTDQKYQQYLQPRPETLAIISHNLFSESFKDQSSNFLNLKNENILKKSSENNTNQQNITKNQNLLQIKSKILISSNENISLENYDKLVRVSSVNEKEFKINQIPFIDDEFDELSYILHRRKYGHKDSKIPIKEETILIKSPLKTGFLQKIASPIRSLSRKNSHKSQSDFNPNSSQKLWKYDKVNKQLLIEKSENKCKIVTTFILFLFTFLFKR